MTVYNINSKIYIIFFTAFMIFFSPLVLSKNVYLVLIPHLLYFVIFRNYKFMNKKIVLISYFVYIFFFLYSFNADKEFIKRMILIIFLITFFIINFINFKAFFMRNSYKENIRYLTLLINLLNIIAIYCIFEYFMKFNPLFHVFFEEPYSNYYSQRHDDLYYRVSGAMQHPIVMGNFLVVNIFFNYMIYKISKRKIYIVTSIINMLALFFTFSRSSYLSFVISLFFYSILSLIENYNVKYLKKKSLWLFIVVILIIINILIIVTSLSLDGKTIYEVIVNRFINLFNEPSLYQRSSGIQFVIDTMYRYSHLINFFFGYGYGSLSYTLRNQNISLYLTDFYVIDNQYFTFFYEIGFIGLFLLLFGVLMIFIKTIKLIFLTKGKSILLKFVLVTFLSILLNIIFYEGFYWTSINFILSFILAFLNYVYLNDISKYSKYNKSTFTEFSEDPIS